MESICTDTGEQMLERILKIYFTGTVDRELGMINIDLDFAK